MKKQVEEGFQDLVDRASKAKEEILKSFSNIPSWFKTLGISGASVDTIADDDADSRSTSPRFPLFHYTHPNLMRFNRHGRIDFTVEEALLTNAYISALTAHIDYWHDVDVAAFLAVELCDLPMRPSYPPNGGKTN